MLQAHCLQSFVEQPIRIKDSSAVINALILLVDRQCHHHTACSDSPFWQLLTDRMTESHTDKPRPKPPSAGNNRYVQWTFIIIFMYRFYSTSFKSKSYLCTHVLRKECTFHRTTAELLACYLTSSFHPSYCEKQNPVSLPSVSQTRSTWGRHNWGPANVTD